MLAAGLNVSLNSDDPAYFGGYVNENFRQVFAALPLDAGHAWQLASNSLRASFAPEADKARWMAQLRACFEAHAQA